MKIIQIEDLKQKETAVYSGLTEAELRKSHDAPGGLFIAESPKVIERALDKGYRPMSLLCEERHIEGDAVGIISKIDSINPETPLFTGGREVLSRLTGYTLTRGVLCAMERREIPSVEEICRGARRLAVLEAITDTTNIGAIFRSAAALGMDGVLLTKDCCDPLNRRAIRVSMGNVFLVPWTWLDGPVERLHDFGFKTAALALTDKSLPIDDAVPSAEERLALVLGTEGDGLKAETISRCDYTLKIPMAYGVDSLNVAAAAAVAFWCHSGLRTKKFTE